MTLMNEGMTFEKATEILACRKTCANKGVECSHDASMALAALMFLEGHSIGHASRDPEVAKLQREIDQMTKMFPNWTFEKNRLEAELSAEREMSWKLSEYLQHDSDCILSQRSAGEPTEDGGYRVMYARKWYRVRPVDETPKCDCGLDDILKATPGHSPEGKEQ